MILSDGTDLSVQVVPELGLEDAGKGVAKHPRSPALSARRTFKFMFNLYENIGEVPFSDQTYFIRFMWLTPRAMLV